MLGKLLQNDTLKIIADRGKAMKHNPPIFSPNDVPAAINTEIESYEGAIYRSFWHTTNLEYILEKI